MRKSDGRDLLQRRRHAIAQEGEWSGKAGLSSPLRGLRSGGSELRFSLWLARTDLRAGELGRALCRPGEVLNRGVLAFGSSACSTAFDRSPALESFADGVSLRSCLAHRDGGAIGGTRIERSFRLAGDGLLVEERLMDPSYARDLVYRIPAAAQEVERSDRSLSYRLS